MAVCRGCGSGNDRRGDEEFYCDLCGTVNRANGSIEYDCDQDASDIQRRIDEFDR